MKLTKKCQYALKAVFELSWRNNGKAIKTGRIAEAQRISTRFTETILNELKHGGYVESRRGNTGGYLIARDPRELTVREIIEYVQGPISLVPEDTDGGANEPFSGNEAFKELWQQVNDAVCEVCDGKTFADLVDSERAARDSKAMDYCI